MPTDKDYQKGESGPVTQNPEIDLSLTDAEILDLIDRKISEYDAYYTKIRVAERSKKMMAYWRNEQEPSKKRGLPEKRYSNNIIHRDLATRIQNATSRMPDIVVMSPEQDEDPNVKLEAKALEDWLSIRFDGDVARRLAQAALRDNHLKLRGVWKYRYDEFRKDAVIERLKPEDVVLDATARIPEDGYTCDNMEFIGEWIEEPTATVLAKFPSKAKELLDDVDRESKKGKPRSSKIRYLQSWATMHDASGKPVELLVHSYNRVLLSKGKTPFWDDRVPQDMQFGLIPSDDLHPAISAIADEIGIDTTPRKPKKYNHFPFARKPYSVFSGENVGDGPIDDTTVVEVSLPLQDIVNMRGDQITLINDWAVPKVIISTKAMTAEKASNISRDPAEIVSVEVPAGSSVESVITTFSGEPASPALYNDLQSSISQIDAHFSTNQIRQMSGESGESKKLVREGDLSTADDIAQTMVQRCVEEAANWLVQLGKIYFDEPRSASAPGTDSSIRSASIAKDTIPDDIQVVVKANAVDKATMRDISMQLVSSKGIDPMSLFEDMDYPNPKERAHRLIDFLNGPPSGYVKYLQDINVDPGKPAGQQSELEGQPQGVQPPQPTPPVPSQAPPVPAQ